MSDAYSLVPNVAAISYLQSQKEKVFLLTGASRYLVAKKSISSPTAVFILSNVVTALRIHTHIRMYAKIFTVS